MYKITLKVGENLYESYISLACKPLTVRQLLAESRIIPVEGSWNFSLGQPVPQALKREGGCLTVCITDRGNLFKQKIEMRVILLVMIHFC